MADITSNLVWHLKCDEEAGATSMLDSASGNNPNLIIGPPIFGGAGKFGNAIDCDGATVAYAKAPNLITLSADFTIAFWMNTSDLTTKQYPIGQHADALQGVELFNSAISMRFNSQFATSIMSIAGKVIVDTWAHIAITRISGAIKGYVGAIQEGTASSAITVVLDKLGTFGGTFTPYSGLLDDVRIYDRGMAPDDLTALLSPYAISDRYRQQQLLIPSAA